MAETDILNLKKQVLEIEENYISKTDLSDYVLESTLDKYLEKTELDSLNSTIDELKIKSISLSNELEGKMDRFDMSNLVTDSILTEKLEQITTDTSTNFYSKTEIDEKLKNIHVDVDLSDYITTDILTSKNYTTIDEVNKVLSENNYLTEHQSLEGYVTTDNIDSLVDTKFNLEFDKIKSVFDGKVNDLKSAYVDTLDKQGYVTNTIVNELISNSLTDYLKRNEFDNVLSQHDLVDSKTLYEFVENYVSTKLENGYIKNDELEEISDKLKSTLPTKLSQLFNDVGYLTEHQSLKGYVKNKTLTKYLTKSEFKLFYDEITSFDMSKFITRDEFNGFTNETHVPTKISELFNDVGYLTKHQSLTDYVKKTDLFDYVKYDDIDEHVLNLISNVDITDKIPSLDLSDYVKKSDIPNKMSDLFNDVGYLTKHQSLIDYVKKSDILNLVSKSEFNKIVDVIDDVVRKDDIKKLVDISKLPTKVSDLFNDSDFITSTKVSKVLEDYLKKDELLGRLKGTFVTPDEFKKRISDLEIGGETHVSKSDLDAFVKKTDLFVPTKISELFNDVGYLTKHQSLIDYVKKSDILDFISKSDLDKLNDKVEKIKLDGFLTVDELDSRNYLNEDRVLWLIKHNRQNLKPYVKSKDLSQYVKKTDLPDWYTFAKKSDLPDLSGYVTEEDIEDFAQVSQIPTKLSDLFDDLTTHVKVSDFTKYQKQVETNQNRIKQSVLEELEDYVKKSDIGELGGLDMVAVDDRISKKMESIHVPTKVSELVNDMGYLTKHQSLSQYVLRKDTENFVRHDYLESTFLKIQDFVLPDDLIKKSDMSKYVTKSELENSTLGVAYKSQLKDYVLKSEYDENFHDLQSSLKSFVSQDEFNDKVNQLISLDKEINLDDYVTKEDLENFRSVSDFKYISPDRTKSLIGTELEKQKKWINDTFATKGSLGNVGGNVVTTVEGVDVESLLSNGYYSKAEAHARFLSKEDYRGIKMAATINFDFNEYPDLFFEVLNNVEDIKIYDGFYVVDDKAYLIKNNQVVPICDRRSPHWEIETEDEDWRDNEEIRKQILNT